MNGHLFPYVQVMKLVMELVRLSHRDQNEVMWSSGKAPLSQFLAPPFDRNFVCMLVFIFHLVFIYSEAQVTCLPSCALTCPHLLWDIAFKRARNGIKLCDWLQNCITSYSTQNWRNWTGEKKIKRQYFGVDETLFYEPSVILYHVLINVAVWFGFSVLTLGFSQLFGNCCVFFSGCFVSYHVGWLQKFILSNQTNRLKDLFLHKKLWQSHHPL